jgi:hypothetical protein
VPHFLLLFFRQTVDLPIRQALQMTLSSSFALFVAAYCGVLLIYWLDKKADIRSFARACLRALIAYLLINSFWFMPWYLVWLMPFAFLSEHYVIFLAVTATGIYAYDNEPGAASAWMLVWQGLLPVWLWATKRWPRLADRFTR